MNTNYAKLSLMMFLQFGIYGLWLPIAGKFLTADPVTEGGLGFSESQMGWIVGMAAAIGAICSPLIVQFADRRFPAQRVLGLLMIIGGVCKLLVHGQSTFFAWLLLSIAFTLMFMPAAAICNALAMRHLEKPDRDFPWVRMWTAIGWILFGWSFSFLALKTNVTPSPLPPFFKGDNVDMMAGAMRQSVLWSGLIAVAYGAWAFFFLPNTPPLAAKGEKHTLTKTFGLLKNRSFAILLVVTLFISPMNTLFFMQCGKFLVEAGLDSSHILPVMALGQFAEIIMYAVLGALLPKLGFRFVLIIGAACWAIRFFVLGTIGLPLGAMIGIMAIHGICYAFYVSTCFIYFNEVAPKDIRNSVQSLFNFIWYGLGPILAVLLNTVLAKRFTEGGGNLKLEGFQGYWYTLGGITLVGFLILLLFFRGEKGIASEEV